MQCIRKKYVCQQQDNGEYKWIITKIGTKNLIKLWIVLSTEHCCFSYYMVKNEGNKNEINVLYGSVRK